MVSKPPRVGKRRVLVHSTWGRVVLGGALVLLLIGGLGWRQLAATVTAYPVWRFNHGQNAVWLEHDWVGSNHDAAAYDQLAARLRAEQVDVVYVHVGPLDRAGTIPPERAPCAAPFVRQLKERLPGLKVLAWIGQVTVQSGAPADEAVDLSSAAARVAIAQTARRFAGPLGFDGVQLDLEPIADGQPDFLALLDTTRALLPEPKTLAVAAPMWVPSAWVGAALVRLAGPNHALWSSGFYARVAQRVDELDVMAYNTGLPVGGLYALAVKQQTQHVLDAIQASGRPVQVRIGVPSYHDNGLWFHDAAENLPNALRGVADGLNDRPRHAAFAGVAVYRFATTTPADWSRYEQQWVGTGRP